MNLPKAMNFHIQDEALEYFSKSYIWPVENQRWVSEVSKGERRGLSVPLYLLFPNTKDWQRKSKCKPSSCTSAWCCSLASPPLQQPQAKGMAKEWKQETPECFLWLLSPPLMIYISGAFRDSNGILCLKVTVFTNEFWRLMLKCKFVPVAYAGFCSEAPSKNLGCRNRCIQRPWCHHQNSVSVWCL